MRLWTSPRRKDRLFGSDEAMQRLAYLMAAGCAVVALYATRSSEGWFIAASVGLMTALAATVAAGLVGFIFGVPYTREGDSKTPTATADDKAVAETPDSTLKYRPNTSLEQISDWLAKMLVGVGLVEIKTVPANLQSVAEYVSRGLGGGPHAATFAAAILVFFAACGFLFGFLWARLYLRRWFSDADREFAAKISRFAADAEAFTLARQLLNPHSQEDSVSEKELLDALNTASTGMKAQIFYQAKQASEDSSRTDFEIKDGIVSIFKALIRDDNKGRYHRNHAELSYALTRRRPQDLEGAEKAISEAIRRRDVLGSKGWRYYEFRRARYRIQQDELFKQGNPSTQTATAAILADLETASTDQAKWSQWLAENDDVRKWMAQNNVNPSPGAIG
jgi:hypothetical protein